MQRRLFWICLIGLLLSLLALLARYEEGMVLGLSSTDLASLLLQGTFLVFLSGTVIVLFRDHLSRALEAALFWIVLGLVLTVGYTYRHEMRDVYERAMAEMVPGRAVSRGRVVDIARGNVGEFRVATQVNGARVPMVLDTGATAVVLTQEAAKAAGLPLEVLNYDVNVDTANGRTRAAAVTLDRVAVGGIIERDVPALIAQPGQLRSNLLGMSFLNRLESWEVRGDRLIMRGYP